MDIGCVKLLYITTDSVCPQWTCCIKLFIQSSKRYQSEGRDDFKSVYLQRTTTGLMPVTACIACSLMYIFLLNEQTMECQGWT